MSHPLTWETWTLKLPLSGITPYMFCGTIPISDGFEVPTMVDQHLLIG